MAKTHPLAALQDFEIVHWLQNMVYSNKSENSNRANRDSNRKKKTGHEGFNCWGAVGSITGRTAPHSGFHQPTQALAWSVGYRATSKPGGGGTIKR
jgi:hypothetical protein